MSSRPIVCVSCLIAALTAGPTLGEPPKPKDGPLGMKFVPLVKGTFYMGCDGRVGTVKKTEIKENFEIAVHTVTQSQWEPLMGKNPSQFSRGGKGKDKVKDIEDEELKLFPVESVSWDDCQEFVKKLNDKEKGSGWVYRLPTEAEGNMLVGVGPLLKPSVRITSTSTSRRTTCLRLRPTSMARFRSGGARRV